MARVIKKKNDNLVSIYHKQDTPVSVNNEKNIFIIQSTVSCKLASASAVVRAWGHWPGTEPRLSDLVTFQRLIITVERWSFHSSTVPAFLWERCFKVSKKAKAINSSNSYIQFLHYVPIYDKV